jgi:hypothetical protein
MSPLAVLLLRRIGLYALVLAALILAGPPILTTFGVIGPSLEEEIDAAARSLQAARSYGAQESEANYLRGSQALERARQHAARKERWQSRRAIAEALASAIEAQRAALATREELRRSAQKVVSDVDRQLNELEDLFTDASKVVGKEESARLFGMMKSVRALDRRVVPGLRGAELREGHGGRERRTATAGRGAQGAHGGPRRPPCGTVTAVYFMQTARTCLKSVWPATTFWMPS